MRIRIAGLFLAALAAAGPAALARDSDLSEYRQPDLPDPVADNGVHFAPGIATAGTADAGPALTSVSPDKLGCSALNPCAVPTPALNDLAPRRQLSRAHSRSNSPS